MTHQDTPRRFKNSCMKHLLLISLLFLLSCGPREEGTYTVQVTYQTGEIDTIKFDGQCCRLVERGCIFGGYNSFYPVCGVRSCKVLKIEKFK